MLNFIRLAKTALISSDYELKNNKLIYKNKEFLLKDGVKNPDKTYFVLALDEVVLFANAGENNFKKAENRQIFKIFLLFILVILANISLIEFNFDILSCLLAISSIILLVLGLLNLVFLKQQIKALKIILSEI